MPPLLPLESEPVLSAYYSFAKPSPPPIKRYRGLRRRSLTSPAELPSGKISREKSSTEPAAAKEINVRNLLRRSSSGTLHETSDIIKLRRRRTVSELVSETKITAAHRVAKFLTCSTNKDSVSGSSKPTLPVPQKTDFRKASYELPEILPSKKVIAILESVPEQVMCFSRRTSLQDSQQFLSLDIVAPSTLTAASSISEDFKPMERQLQGRGRRMSLPVNTNSIQQFTSYELSPPEEFVKVRETVMQRRHSLPHNIVVDRPKRRFSVDLPRVRWGSHKKDKMYRGQPMLKENVERFL